MDLVDDADDDVELILLQLIRNDVAADGFEGDDAVAVTDEIHR